MSDADKAVDIAKEIAKDVYTDGGRPVVKPTGELLGLIPRAIKAALAPAEKWILQREYNIAETQKLLEEKLKNIPPEQIEAPEAYIAVPALQNISYCMDNAELRDMYANLLANSMNKVVKNGVHPGFVEIIKQLSPDEAKILRYMSSNTIIPTITLRCVNEKEEGYDVVKNFSNVGELAKCEYPFEVGKYFDNLIRLGLLKNAMLASLTNKALYEPLKKHQYLESQINTITHQVHPFNKPKFKEGYISITDFGKSFCEICLCTTETITLGFTPNP